MGCVACVAGVIGEGEGERGRREKMRGIGSPIPLVFSRLPRSPSPSPITPATQATWDEIDVNAKTTHILTWQTRLLPSLFKPNSTPEIKTRMQPIIIKLFKFGEDILIYLKGRKHDTLCMEDCLSNRNTGKENI